MHPSLLPLLVSPDDRSPLTLIVTAQDGDDIRTGTLQDAAGRTFPIEDGIPRLLPGAMLDAQKSEIAARDAQVEAYDAMSGLNAFGKVEIPMVLRRLQPQPTDRLLEAGCGTGRMTQVLAGRVRELTAIDFSFESLRVNAKKLQAAGITNVHLVQADLCRLPFAPAVFDRIVSCQVLEHVPGDAARRAAVVDLSRVARSQASLVLSAYQHSFATRLFGQKEGEHDGGIPFFRFTRPEFRETLSTAFSVESVTGALVYLYLARCRNRA
jgi:ubiquinone/menaquinone biosynthesis C-methylase UbiE